MWLTTEAFGKTTEVTAVDVERILATDEFGSFAQLFASEKNFIQAGKDVPGLKQEAFLLKYGAEPWVLQYGYGDEETGRVFQAVGRLTLEQVRQAFLSFFAGGEDWRRQHTWVKHARQEDRGGYGFLAEPWAKHWREGIVKVRLSTWLLFGCAALLVFGFLRAGVLAGRWNEEMNASDIGKLVMALVAFLAGGLFRGHAALRERVLALEKAHEALRLSLEPKSLLAERGAADGNANVKPPHG